MASLKKIKRGDFVALLGYHGRNAVVDKKFASTHNKKGALELAELGYYRAAVCAAIYDDGDNGEKLVEWLHSRNIFPDYDYEGLKLLFGVLQVEAVERVIAV